MKIPGLEKPHRIFAEVVEPQALEQFKNAMMLDCVEQGALMPDVHTGYTLPIGAVIATRGFVFPSFVGYDIGCGVCAVKTSFHSEAVREQAQKIFSDTYAAIPVGFNHNSEDSVWPCSELERTEAMDEIFSKNGLRQLGSLGSGNHFLEVGVDAETDDVWIIVHSGSRGVGHAAATRYMKIASGDGKAREGLYGLSTECDAGRDYIVDLAFCLAFALENRRQLASRLASVISQHCDGAVDWDSLVNRNHNHADLKDGLWIHRKGATHAEKDMMGVIPANMRDGSFIVRGLGNPESLQSSSHGAGRVMGRKVAKNTLSLDTFESLMDGVVARVEPDTLDEAPMAYKDIFDVMRLQVDLVEIVRYIKPIINIKG